MLKKSLLPVIFIVMTYGFWISPDFKEIAAGVAIFLFGMLCMDQGFKSFTGGKLEKILRKSTASVWKSLCFGAISTGLMQSSSLISLLSISFLSAGLIKLTSGIGIVFGANLGTTTGAWLIAGLGLKVKISAYAMPMLVFGVMGIFQRSKTLNGLGYILTGLGFLFLGIQHMKDGFEAFRSIVDLTEYAIEGTEGLLIYCLLGILATVIMQSSHATLVLILTALSAQQIAYENALALAIGTNVGTTVTAIIGSLSSKAQGKRLAAAHFIFNLVTGVIAFLLINQLILLVDLISEKTGIAADDYTLKLALFHSLFNAIGICIMLPLINPLGKWLKKLIKQPRLAIDQPKFLVKSAIEFPDTVVEAVRNETLHVYQNTLHIILKGLSLHRGDLDSNESSEQIIARSRNVIVYDIDEAYRQSIKGIYSAIIEFISLAGFSWKMLQSSDIYWLRQANQTLVEAIKDVKHLRKNLVPALSSDNRYLLNEYNQIRIMLFQTVRGIEALQKLEHRQAELDLEKLKHSAEKTYNKLNKNISKLLNKNLITPESATSLMNDGTYAYDVAKNLIKSGETLFVMQKKTPPSEKNETDMNELEAQL